MKKILILLFFICSVIFINSSKAEAYMSHWKYYDGGGIYTNTKIPIDVAKAENGETDVDLKNLKSGEAVTRNILFLVEIGDASIKEAARKGGITKVKYVDSKCVKVFIPLGFIPILVKETKKGEWQVQFGSIKMNVKQKDLEIIHAEENLSNVSYDFSSSDNFSENSNEKPVFEF
mgnify:CR=1 FL=1